MTSATVFRPHSLVVLLAAALLLSACGHRSSADTETSPTYSGPVESDGDIDVDAIEPTNPDDIIVTRDDITDRAYETIGDIEVTVSKTTIFDSDPSEELVDEAIREEAAELGADAVILVRYGTVGISLFSWGTMDGQGRAVRFVE